MTTDHIQVLLALAERARAAGLIQFNEMQIVSAAVTAAKQAVEQANAPQESSAATESATKKK